MTLGKPKPMTKKAGISKGRPYKKGGRVGKQTKK